MANVTSDTLIERLTGLEYASTAASKEEEELICCVPTEANFQLPNEFLRTAMNRAAERLFSKYESSDIQAIECKEAIALLDETVFEEEEDFPEKEYDHEVFQRLVHAHIWGRPPTNTEYTE